jgi:hypothetical protein
MKKNLRLMEKVLATLKENCSFTKKERKHVNLLFMVSGDATVDDLCELTEDLPAGNLPLLTN